MDDYNKRQPYDVEGPDYVRPRIVDGEDDAVKIVNTAQRERYYKKMAEDYERAYLNSTSKEEKEYKPKKKKISVKFITFAVCSIALIGSFVLLIRGCAPIKTTTMDESTAITLVEKDEVDDVDELIEAYQTLMDSNGPIEYRIENAYEYNEKNHEANVDYNYGTLYNVIVDASQDSEKKARCALLAAYNVVNEPYREEVFDRLFASIQKNEEVAATLPSFMKAGSWDNFIKVLGYEGVKEYNNNERKNIKKLSEEILIPNPKTNR